MVDVLKTLKVRETDYKRILNLKGRLQADRVTNVSLREVITYLLDKEEKEGKP